MRLLIAIPCMDTVRFEFAESLANLCKHLSNIGIDYDLKWHATSLIYLAREDLADYAISEDYDYTLWLDSDMIFTPDMFDLLLGLNEPFATGIYRSRRSPYSFVLKNIENKKVRIAKIPDDPFKVAACGFGFVLIKTEAMYQVRAKYMTMFTPTAAEGEDYAFCTRYLEMDKEHRIIAHPNVIPSHVGYIYITGKDPQKLVEYKEML